MYTVSELENIFERNPVGYWSVHLGSSNVATTSKDLVNVADSSKQYADFLEALDMLKDDSYTLRLYSAQASSKTKKEFKFIKGDVKIGNSGRDTGANVRVATPSYDLFAMVLNMQQQSSKQQMDMMMLMMNMQVQNKDVLMEKSLAHQEAVFKGQKDLELLKQEHSKSLIDKAIGAITNPNMSKFIQSLRSEPTAVGRSESSIGDEVDENIKDRTQSNETQRLVQILSRIKAFFPILNPLDVLEILLGKIDADPSIIDNLFK